jgi:hypothetical protein
MENYKEFTIESTYKTIRYSNLNSHIFKSKLKPFFLVYSHQHDKIFYLLKQNIFKSYYFLFFIETSQSNCSQTCFNILLKNKDYKIIKYDHQQHLITNYYFETFNHQFFLLEN